MAGARRSGSVGRTIAVFVALAVLVLVLVAAAGFLVIRRVAVDRALQNAEERTLFAAELVQSRTTNGILTGDAFAVGQISTVVTTGVLREPVVRVKLWGPGGEILYSDAAKAIGKQYDSGADELSELSEGEVTAEVSDLSAPENATEQGFGSLLEVYTKIETPNGQPLLFETYQRMSAVDEQRQQLLRDFAPVLVVALIALAALLLPLAWILARRLQRVGQEREQALQRSLDASDRERRRIAGDLHDGPVQELAGLSMRLSAASGRTSDPAQRDVLQESAAAVRASVRTLRSAIVGVYPPNLEAAGLEPALADLTARLPREGLEVSLDVADPAGYGTVVDQLLYRVCQEALRNVEKHAGASHVTVRVQRHGGAATLEVIDDGRGVGDSARSQEQDGHFGLRIVDDLVRDAGGTLSVGPGSDGSGTVVRVEVPTS
jgi:signal transduction histidine kinase